MKKSRTEFPAGRCKGGRWENVAPDDVPDELLELIFLRLPSSLHLIRVGCTCKNWRRVVADGGFLRRFQALHPPSVVGHYRVYERAFGSCPPDSNPVFSLSPSTGTASDLRAHNFSLDFLPPCDCGSWNLADSRGGILLLRDRTWEYFWPQLRQIVVCDPMMRSCSMVITPPAFHGCYFLGAFLLDNNADESGEAGISVTNFRILVVIYGKGIARSCVFSSSNCSGGGWTVTTSKTVNRSSIYFVGHVADYVYWTTVLNEILVLDKNTAELKSSYLLLPDVYVYSGFYSRSRVVRCRDGEVRIALLIPEQGHLRVFIQAEGRDEWVEEKSIQLLQLIPEVQVDGGATMLINIVSVAEGSVVLGTKEGVGLASVDLATMEFERVEKDVNKYHGSAHVYCHGLRQSELVYLEPVVYCSVITMLSCMK